MMKKNKEAERQSCMRPACMKKKGKMPSRHAPSVQALLNVQSCALLNGSSDEEGQKGFLNRHLTLLVNGGMKVEGVMNESFSGGFYLCTLKKDATLLRTPQKLVVTYVPSLELFFSLMPFRRHSVRCWPFGGSDMWDQIRKIPSLPLDHCNERWRGHIFKPVGPLIERALEGPLQWGYWRGHVGQALDHCPTHVHIFSRNELQGPCMHVHVLLSTVLWLNVLLLFINLYTVGALVRCMLFFARSIRLFTCSINFDSAKCNSAQHAC